MNFTMKVEGDKALEARLFERGVRGDATARGAVALYGAMLKARVRRHASGRPGPNVVTGAYVESIDVEYSSRGGGYTARVYSNAPQARRLELGFFDVDSLGRHYQQRPFPHFGPAIMEISSSFVATIAAVARA